MIENECFRPLTCDVFNVPPRDGAERQSSVTPRPIIFKNISRILQESSNQSRDTVQKPIKPTEYLNVSKFKYIEIGVGRAVAPPTRLQIPVIIRRWKEIDNNLTPEASTSSACLVNFQLFSRGVADVVAVVVAVAVLRLLQTKRAAGEKKNEPSHAPCENAF